MTLAPPDTSHTSSFFLPMRFMPLERREDLLTLYRFCRVVDDSVDEVESLAEAQANVAFWRDEIRRMERGEAQHPQARALQDVMQRYLLPYTPLQELLLGMETDCAPSVEISDEAALETYCYRVAGSVGILAARIMAGSDPSCERFAVTLGHALQLTNILRDLTSDRKKNRNYVPLSWYARYHIEPNSSDPSDLGSIATILHDRACAYFERTRSELPHRFARRLLPALLMRDSYERLLARVMKSRAYLREEKMRLGGWDKMRIAGHALGYLLTLPRSGE